ncbi:hypothetical protein POVWA1_013520 [Plasmodium ovale wallikeri]|uniref:Uncharacterized protein n=1 Tax=Plasmodium ovale wallikeri TaxID=864142 RepID=A0A1A8YMJ6_PLAOA|nr:hypothetical protein POVWA1_013520 [Plasmodium ovale wallikeri]
MRTWYHNHNYRFTRTSTFPAGLTWICLGHSSGCQLRCEKRRGTIKSMLSSGYNARARVSEDEENHCDSCANIAITGGGSIGLGC